MGIKITAIGLIVISGIIGANFIIRNSLIKNVNLSDVNLDTGHIFNEKSQENLKIENPIKWVNEQKNISEAISEIKKTGSEIGKIIKDAQSSLPLSLQIAVEMGTSSAVDAINNNENSGALKTATSSQPTLINNQLIAISSQATTDINNNINPRNLENIDYLISEVKKIGVKQNMSNEKLLAAEKVIREAVATSTDLMAEFYKSANIKYTSAEGEGFFKKLLSLFNFIKISQAQSAMGTAFGGQVMSAIKCTCNPTAWLVTFMPLQPTYATLLSYLSGTQLYLNKVPVPHAKQYFLGFYDSTSATTICKMISGPTCITLPDWGLIMPTVSSSL